jgi:hypothetical protein
MNSWISVFSQSRVNNAPYGGDRLPDWIWRWPADTWFQTRVRYLRGLRREDGERKRFTGPEPLG